MASANKYMIIDGSYYIFHRFYAVANWFQMQNPLKEYHLDRLAEDSEFLAKYNRLFGENITRLMKRHKIHSKDSVLIVEDCPRSSIWRSKMFPEYKKSRKPSSVDPKIFHHSLHYLAPELGIRVLAYPNAEADDIAYVVGKNMADKGAIVTIITNDNDYLQMYDKDKIEIFNVQGLDLSTRMMGLTAEEYLRYKVLIGDKSDNIPSAIPRVGPKKAMVLLRNDEKLHAALNANSSLHARFNENDTLMNFEKIPLDISVGIQLAYTKKMMNGEST
jgi:5'-3' exonuclease